MQGQDWWRYENLPSGEPYDWGGAARGTSPYDNIDFHLDIGCGRLPKGRLGIDRFWTPDVPMLLMDLEDLVPASELALPGEAEPTLMKTVELFNAMALDGADSSTSAKVFLTGLPFPDGSIESIISHHCMEHLLDGFLPLMDECYRVLKPGGILRAITPLFPSKAAVEDPDHKRYIMEETFETFCGAQDGSHWHESFSTPYTSCRFEMVDKDITAGVKPRASWGDPDAPGIEPDEAWGPKDVREIRVALRKWD